MPEAAISTRGLRKTYRTRRGRKVVAVQGLDAEIMPGLVQGSSYVLAFAAFLIGASFVGAEFSSGAIGNWLTFEPRRLRVYGSKLLAAATGLLLRHTAAAIGVVMAYLVLAEGVFAAFVEKAQPWLVKVNFDAFVRHDAQYYVTECKSGNDGSYACDYVPKTLSFEHGAWYLAILAVVVVLLGGWVFHRRDVN